MRKLAHIETIKKLQPIFLVDTNEPAENIELATVLGWNVVVKKGEYNVGDKTVFIETDAIVPEGVEAFEFLSSRKYRVKTMKLNKFYYGGNKDNRVVSQGLCVKPDALKVKDTLKDGHDLTKELKITKIEEITPEVQSQSLNSRINRLQKNHWFMKTKVAKWLMKYRLTRNILLKLFLPKQKPKAFPAYIAKTDETRVQALPDTFEYWQGKRLQITEKLDGTSTTFGLQKKGKKFDFAVCSRNVRQLDHNQKTWYLEADTNFYWEMAFKYNVKDTLEKLFVKLNAKDHVVLQGETMGPSIQSNLLGLPERQFFAFNLVVDGVKINSVQAKAYVNEVNKDIQWVPILDDNFFLPSTIDELLDFATGPSVLGNKSLREGLVIRDADNKVSFKAVSREWLLKYKR